MIETVDGRPLCTTSYTYDNMGRIESITANGNITTYTYDSYGQLIREDNQVLDKTFQYVYNDIGNVMSVTTYDYTPKGTEPIGDGIGTYFHYSNISNYDYLIELKNNPDNFTVFEDDEEDAGYDFGGYPDTYKDVPCLFDPIHRRLIRYGVYPDENSTLSSEYTAYTYDAFGNRVRKQYVYNPGSDYSGDYPIGNTTEYTYDHNGRLLREFTKKEHTAIATQTKELNFLYDESGMIGFTYSVNGATPTSYYYQRNLLGDVIGIYNTSGTKIVEYAYDAWGNCTVIYGANNTLANDNPIRYRGYYYDTESGLYYLNARYYSPEWRRFISPDDTSYLDPESVNGLNLYCYCGNDPVNRYDPSGYANVIKLRKN